MTTGTTWRMTAVLMAEILMQTTSSGLSLAATVEDSLSIPAQTLDLEISFSSLAKAVEHTLDKVKSDPQSPHDAHTSECLAKISFKKKSSF